MKKTKKQLREEEQKIKEEKDRKKRLGESEHLKDTVAMFKSYVSAKESTTRKWRIIKAFYDGDFWEKLKEKIKNFSLTPDTNYIEYVVSAYVNSIYSGTYIPEVSSITKEKEEVAAQLNAFIEISWLNMSIKSEFTTWGENVSLYNMQPVKAYLDKTGKNKKVLFEDIDPFTIYLDPSVKKFKDGAAVFISKEVNAYDLLQDERFIEKAKKYIEENKDSLTAININSNENVERFTTLNNQTLSLLEYYVKTKDGIRCDFILNEEVILYTQARIKPNRFPIEILYERKPTGNPYGTPRIYKILNSYITLNLLDSMDGTVLYLAMNRPKFFDLRSRINPQAFVDYGNTPNSTFPLFGDPSKAVHYQDVQTMPDTTNYKNRLEAGIFQITGVDPAYKGRQTNSIITTGGVEAQQARVIMLTDNQPLVALETFTEDLGKLFIELHFEFISKVKTLKDRYNKDNIELDLSKEDIEDFKFVLESKPYLPLTKATLFEQLKALYEMQGQYRFQIAPITEEDLINELPVNAVMKKKILDRIKKQKQESTTSKMRETLLTFASIFQELQSQGMSDEESAVKAIEIMEEEEMQKQQDPRLGVNQANEMPIPGQPAP